MRTNITNWQELLAPYGVDKAYLLPTSLADVLQPQQTGGGVTLSPAEVAKVLKVSHDKVLGWINSGQLKASNLNNPGARPRYAIAKDDLSEFLKRRQPAPKPAKPRKRARPDDDVIEFFK